jgi:hypothetical protein
MDAARLEETAEGLVPQREGRFVLNARDSRWYERPGRSPLCIFEGEPEFPQVGGQPPGAETTDPDTAYSRFADRRPTRYRDGWLPGPPSANAS